VSLFHFKKIPESEVLDYTRLMTVVLYEGGAHSISEQLLARGVKEVYYYSVRGAPVGKSSENSGLPEIPKTEILHAVVAADQADYIQDMIYDAAELYMPQRGIIFVNKLLLSTRNNLPSEEELAGKAA
jgi:hypothetical protein